MLKDKNILIGITGGIAAYKICTLIRLFKKEEANVRVVVTPNALNFVTKLTLQSLSNNDVYVDAFEIEEYKPEHIALTESDIFVIAPASANTIGKIANGICDNLLLSTACAFKNPILIAPAMNNNMWENAFVQENVNRLKNAGYHVMGVNEGFLACGTTAKGRMKEPEEIFDETVKILDTNRHSEVEQSYLPPKNRHSLSLLGKKILITAGGTREKIDPVRYITNNSSGKMGVALAENAVEMGADVTLISTFAVNGKFKNIITETAQEMEKAVKDNISEQDCVIMAAAVSDYRIKNYSEQKIKKGVNDSLTLELVKNPDILKEISAMKSKAIIIGFCAESENLIENAKIKIQNKGCDFLVANDISRKDIGFNSNENEVYIIDKNLNTKHLEKDSKQNIAKKILEGIFE